MKSVSYLVLGVLMLVSQAAYAGALYGTVRFNQTYAANLTIVVKCPGISEVKAVTDSRGSYSLHVPVSGRCQMQVWKDKIVGTPFEVVVSNNPIRFDFEVNNSMNRIL